MGRCQEERRAVMLKQLIKWFGPEAQDPIDYVDTWILQFLEWIFKFCKYIFIYIRIFNVKGTERMYLHDT